MLWGHIQASEEGDFDFEAFLAQSINESWDVFEPPPDDILYMPPPPLPPSLRHIIWGNQSLADEESSDGTCNFCHLFQDKSQDSEYVSPKNPEKTTDSMMSVLVASVLGLIFGSLLLILIWCKKWRIFPAKDSCPIFSDGFLGSHKSVPSPPSAGDQCISPVVNEKSPQSIITDAPSKKTSIPSKYWTRGREMGVNINGSRVLDPSSSLDDQYTEGGSCTSSPVYAELDGAVPGSRLSLDPSTGVGPVLIAGPSQSMSPYSVGQNPHSSGQNAYSSGQNAYSSGQNAYSSGQNPYADVPEALRMGIMGSSSALIPDSSYDNAAYLPSALAGHYTRSLRRGQGITLAHLGSAAPLLSQSYHLPPQPNMSYLTGGRQSKKPRAPFAQQLARNAMQRMQQDVLNERMDRAAAAAAANPRYTSRRIQALYSDPPIDSPNMSTFKSASPLAHHLRDNNPKRPLPPVPGVRL